MRDEKQGRRLTQRRPQAKLLQTKIREKRRLQLRKLTEGWEKKKNKREVSRNEIPLGV